MTTNTEISTAAAALGRKGGSAKSEAKASTARANGAKGGRPTLSATLYRVGTAPRVGVTEPGVAALLRKGLAHVDRTGESVKLTADGIARFKAENC